MRRKTGTKRINNWSVLWLNRYKNICLQIIGHLLSITSFLNYCLLYLCLPKPSPVPLYLPIRIQYLSVWSATLNVAYSVYLMLPSKSSWSTLKETLPATVTRWRLSFPSPSNLRNHFCRTTNLDRNQQSRSNVSEKQSKLYRSWSCHITLVWDFRHLEWWCTHR